MKFNVGDIVSFVEINEQLAMDVGVEPSYLEGKFIIISKVEEPVIDFPYRVQKLNEYDSFWVAESEIELAGE